MLNIIEGSDIDILISAHRKLGVPVEIAENIDEEKTSKLTIIGTDGEKASLLFNVDGAYLY